MTQGADYRVDLSIYNGPLDLLLYLIKEREVQIHDIPIAEITESFLAHIEVVKRIDIDRAGDFLLVAATLMLIKSRLLLPRGDEELDELGEEFDPRTDLVRQLLEYKEFKDLSRTLAGAHEERTRRFGGGMQPPAPDAPDAGRLLEDLGVDDLLLAFERMMRETLAEVDHRVFGEDLPLRELQADLLRRMEMSGGAVLFREFFLGRRDRYYIVSVFLSLLELLKAGRVEIAPGTNVADLTVRLRPQGLRPQGPGPANRLP